MTTWATASGLTCALPPTIASMTSTANGVRITESTVLAKNNPRAYAAWPGVTSGSMAWENIAPTGAIASVTSATITAGCNENTLQTITATIGYRTFMARSDRASRDGLLKTYGKSAGATRMPMASTPRKMLTVSAKPTSV